jgi:hypothetical protein
MVGPSSGLVFAGILNFIKEKKAVLDNYRNKKGEINIVFLC